VILVDTSVWIEHLRSRETTLERFLNDGVVLAHPFVVGELSLGSLKRRGEVLDHLAELPEAPVAEHQEVRTLVERRRLHGAGIGWIDAHLLASALLAATSLWTLDRRLAAVVTRLGVAPPF
jgi:predicted nucleic acid-binding protein